MLELTMGSGLGYRVVVNTKLVQFVTPNDPSSAARGSVIHFSDTHWLYVKETLEEIGRRWPKERN